MVKKIYSPIEWYDLTAYNLVTQWLFFIKNTFGVIKYYKHINIEWWIAVNWNQFNSFNDYLQKSWL